MGTIEIKTNGKEKIQLQIQLETFEFEDDYMEELLEEHKEELNKFGHGLIRNIIKGNLIKGNIDFIKVDINA
jgi:hypothetical protein